MLSAIPVDFCEIYWPDLTFPPINLWNVWNNGS